MTKRLARLAALFCDRCDLPHNDEYVIINGDRVCLKCDPR